MAHRGILRVAVLAGADVIQITRQKGPRPVIVQQEIARGKPLLRADQLVAAQEQLVIVGDSAGSAESQQVTRIRRRWHVGQQPCRYRVETADGNPVVGEVGAGRGRVLDCAYAIGLQESGEVALLDSVAGSSCQRAWRGAADSSALVRTEEERAVLAAIQFRNHHGTPNSKSELVSLERISPRKEVRGIQLVIAK